jgi:hypothetical protein
LGLLPGHAVLRAWLQQLKLQLLQKLVSDIAPGFVLRVHTTTLGLTATQFQPPWEAVNK